MRILSCFKVVPDLEMLIEDDWLVMNNQVDTSFAKKEINCFDESALEIALRLSDKSKNLAIPSELTGISIGGQDIDLFLKKLLALRFDQAVRIDNQADLRFVPEVIAELLSIYIQKNPPEVIMFGWQSGVGDNGQTPLILAELLGWPCISQVIDIDLDQLTNLTVTNQVDDGFMKQVVTPPIIFTVGNAQITKMRVPSLKDKMDYGRRPITVIPSTDLISTFRFSQITQSKKLINLENINHQRAGEIIDSGTAEEKARILFDRYLKERLVK